MINVIGFHSRVEFACRQNCSCSSSCPHSLRFRRCVSGKRTGEHIWLRTVQRWGSEMRKTEGGRASEAVSLWGCRQREECGFHGNLRKAELWVPVPALTALHCTGPRFSVGSFLPSSPTLYLFSSLYRCCFLVICASLIITLHLVSPQSSLLMCTI